MNGTISSNLSNGFTISSPSATAGPTLADAAPSTDTSGLTTTTDTATQTTDTTDPGSLTGGLSIVSSAGSTDGSTSVTVKPLGVDSSATAPVVANGDSLVYADTAPATDTAVRPTDSGIETFDQIRDASAPQEFAYAIGAPNGDTIQVNPDRSASVIDANGNDIADAAAPTATDADGNPVRAYFTTDGNVLTMHVNHRVDGVTYPVVADPRISMHVTHADIYFNRTETRFVGHGGAWALGGAIGAAIGSIGGAPGWIIGGAAVGGALASIGADTVDTKLSHGQCLHLNLIWFGWPWNLGPHISRYGC